MTPESLAKYKKDCAARAEREARWKAEGLCRDCGQFPKYEKYVVCILCHNARTKRNNNKRKEKVKNGICMGCSKPHSRGKNLCEECTLRNVEGMRLRRKETKEMIYAHFGKKCACCAETDIRVMSLDHVNNDGRIDKLSSSGKKQITPAWYAKLRRIIESGEPFPRELQMLCFNCHAKKDLQPWWWDENDS